MSRKSLAGRILRSPRGATCALFLLAMPERLVRFRRIIAPVREARWSFVALGAAAVVFMVAGPWMISTVTDFIRRTFENLPSALG